MNLKISVNPNPFTTELAVLIHGQFAVNTVLRLINNNGTVIRVTSCAVNKGDNKIKINNLRRYAAGNYLFEIKLLNGDLMETINLIKK